jgi:hypothetical protein
MFLELASLANQKIVSFFWYVSIIEDKLQNSKISRSNRSRA